MYSTVSTASKRNEVIAGLLRALAVRGEKCGLAAVEQSPAMRDVGAQFIAPELMSRNTPSITASPS